MIGIIKEVVAIKRLAFMNTTQGIIICIMYMKNSNEQFQKY